VLMSVFSFLFKDPSYKLQLVVGLFLWDFFAEGTKSGLAALHAKSFLFRKLRVPLWILVIAAIANPFITLMVSTMVIVLFLTAIGQPPSLVAVGLFAFYSVSMTLIVVGFSLAASVLFLKYRDLNQVWDMVTQAGFFLAPIIYPLNIVPERFHFYFYIWPPTPIIEFSRAALVSGHPASVLAHVYLVLEVAVVLAVGTIVLKRMGPRAAELV